MKRIIGLSLVIVLAITTLTSCRKGPEDPFFSFITRKGRLTNNWTAQSYTIGGIDQLYHVTNDSIDHPDCGKQYISDTMTSVYFIDIKKDGTYKANQTFNTKQLSTAPGSLCTDLNYNTSKDSTSITDGFWNFTGSVGDVSNREQLFLFDEETQRGVIWDIVGLRSDEVHLSRKYIIPGQSEFTYEDLVLVPR
ncbi:MAG: hypothetical protein K1X55_01955 [Chitinophagales bacterium]|nr:hypothetical protein [Chitinophagales bacterium]